MRQEARVFILNRRLRIEERVLYCGELGDYNLFLHRWAAAVFDEVHGCRTEGQMLRALAAIRDRSRITVGASATPLYNGVRDLVSIALGMGAVTANSMNNMEKLYATALRKATTKDREAVSKEATRQAAKGFLGGPGGTLLAVKMTENQMKIKMEMVREIKDKCGDIVIRRRPDSRDPEGNRLFGLPDLVQIDFPVHPTDTEAEIFEEMRQDAAAQL
ncbi:hypothetical protein SCHPADRAFT_948419 [Schizopora paradoxa]|uniref:Helicase ATP-binding domain-containing protein n=1 Tax=Schizopora paradoxa TaxID=27342 RepID=A0A0H2RFM7_9AGAM|nr:hypothetical protein SCHPADRAFT_948419 [Schizopora paradoxa]